VTIDASLAVISTTGTRMLTIYPGITVAANVAVATTPPRTYRVVWPLGGTTPSFTMSIGVSYLD